jgi:uncharacterized membrane protein YbhN (UPF0104 family)
MKQKSILKNIEWLLVTLTVIAILYFVAKNLFENISKFDMGAVNGINFNYLIAGMIFFFLVNLLLNLGWFNIFRVLHRDLTFKKSIWVYSTSILAKYVPGKVPQILGRGYMAKKGGFSGFAASGSAIIEIILKSITSLMIGIIYVINFNQSKLINMNLFILLSILFLIIILISNKKVMSYMLKMMGKIFKKRFNLDKISFLELMKTTLVYAVIYHIIGFVVLLCYLSISNSTEGLIAKYILLTGAFSLSWILGNIIIFIPAGLGIREGIFVFLTQGTVGLELSILLIIIFRILTILSDIVYLFFGFLTRKI